MLARTGERLKCKWDARAARAEPEEAWWASRLGEDVVEDRPRERVLDAGREGPKAQGGCVPCPCAPMWTSSLPGCIAGWNGPLGGSSGLRLA